MSQLKQINDHNVQWYDKIFPCVIGKNGFTDSKIEGDKKTPIGQFKLEFIYYRSDRVKKPQTALPTFAITPLMGWSDDPQDKFYNTLVNMPYTYSHETLYRADHLYDLVIITSHNRHPAIPGKGSAIFIHNWHKENENIPCTLGCLAMSLENLYLLLETADQNTMWNTII